MIYIYTCSDTFLIRFSVCCRYTLLFSETGEGRICKDEGMPGPQQTTCHVAQIQYTSTRSRATRGPELDHVTLSSPICIHAVAFPIPPPPVYDITCLCFCSIHGHSCSVQLRPVTTRHACVWQAKCNKNQTTHTLTDVRVRHFHVHTS